MLLLAGVALTVLACVITFGAIMESHQQAETAAVPVAPTPQPSAASKPAASTAPPVPESSESQDEDEPVERDETHLRFGQTAHFTTSAGRSNTPLEFTISAPKRFKPSKHATYWDAVSSVGGKGKRQPANVYFKVTVKNT